MSEGGGAHPIEKIIKAAVGRGASDVLMKAGDVFRARINGKLVPLTKQRLTPDQTRAIAQKLIGQEDRARIERLRDFDCSWGMAGVGRFRVNILRQRSSFMIVMRVIPFEVPTIESLQLPPVLTRVAEADRGLVLVTGVSGSGKSSTLAGIINHVNRNLPKHIVTIENPIEFLHRDLKASVTQREVGVDTDSFAVGLSAALRQDPDVIVLSEIPDTLTLDRAVKAAEMGHLVLAVLPAPDVRATFTRLLAMIPADERQIGRLRLADTIRAVISQRLLPREDGEGRVAALEILLDTPDVRDALKDPDRMNEIPALLAAGREEHETQRLEQHLSALAEAGTITAETARAAANEPDALTLPEPGKGKSRKHRG